MIKKLISNTLSNYIMKAVTLLLNVIAIPFLLSSLGESGFGVLMFASAITGYFTFLEFGIAAGVTKYVAQYLQLNDYNKIHSIISTSLTFFFVIGFILGTVVILLTTSGSIELFFDSLEYVGNYRNVFIASGLVAIFSWPQILLNAVLRGAQEYVVMNWSIGIGRIIAVSLAVVCSLYFSKNLTLIFLAFNLDRVFITFWQMLLVRKTFPAWRYRVLSFDSTVFKSMFSFSAWIMLGQIAVILEYQSDQLLILKFLGPAAISTYIVIFYLFRLTQQASGLTASALMPLFSQLSERLSKDDLHYALFKAVRYHNLAYVPVTLVILLLSKSFLNLWVGEEYVRYLWLIQLSLAFQLLWQSSAAFGEIYRGLGYSKKPGILALFIGVSNVLVSLWLVRSIGVEGVVLGTVIVGTIVTPFGVTWMVKDIGISPVAYFGNIIKVQGPLVLSSILFFFIENLLEDIDSWIDLSIFGVLLWLYFQLVIFLFVLKQEEIFIIRTKIRKFVS